MKKQNTNTSSQSNSNRRITTNMNRINSNPKNINPQRSSVTQKKTTVSNPKSRISMNEGRTYTSRNNSSRNTTTLAKQNNQNWGLWFTKLIIQIALCFLFYFAVYAIITDYAGEAYDFAYQIFGDVCVEPSSEKKVKVTIPKNASLKEVASLLADKELIKNEYSFYIRSKLSTNKKREIIPGTYV